MLWRTIVAYFLTSASLRRRFSDTGTSRPRTCLLGPHTGYYKILPRALFILEPVDCDLSLLLRLGIPYPDNPETSFSVLVFNPYQVSGPHFPSHSGQKCATAADATCHSALREQLPAHVTPRYSYRKIRSRPGLLATFDHDNHPSTDRSNPVGRKQATFWWAGEWHGHPRTPGHLSRLPPSLILAQYPFAHSWVFIPSIADSMANSPEPALCAF